MELSNLEIGKSVVISNKAETNSVEFEAVKMEIKKLSKQIAILQVEIAKLDYDFRQNSKLKKP